MKLNKYFLPLVIIAFAFFIIGRIQELTFFTHGISTFSEIFFAQIKIMFIKYLISLQGIIIYYLI